MTPHAEVQTQFVLRLDEHYRSAMARYPDQLSGALGQALAVSFGLPYPTPVRISIRYGLGSELLEANGITRRVPDPLEVQGVLIGVLIGLTTALTLQPRALDLTRERVNDA